MGQTDIVRQELNVFKIKTLGAEVIPVTSGTATLKDALNESIRDWVTNVDDTHYIIGSVTGPHPYPTIVRDFNAIAGYELKEQSLAQIGSLPDMIIACVGDIEVDNEGAVTFENIHVIRRLFFFCPSLPTKGDYATADILLIWGCIIKEMLT